MINEGNSLNELMEKVLLASLHATTSDSTLKAPSQHYDPLKWFQEWLRTWDKVDKARMLMWHHGIRRRNKSSLINYAKKGDRTAISGVSLTGTRKAHLVILDDLITP